MDIDFEGKKRGLCTIHTLRHRQACRGFSKIMTSNACRLCGCVARRHVDLTVQERHSCPNCRTCKKYQPGVGGTCLECDCPHGPPLEGGIPRQQGIKRPHGPPLELAQPAIPPNLQHQFNWIHDQVIDKRKKKQQQLFQPHRFAKGAGRPKKIVSQKKFSVGGAHKSDGNKWKERPVTRQTILLTQEDDLLTAHAKCRSVFGVESRDVCLRKTLKGPNLTCDEDVQDHLTSSRSNLLYFGWVSDDVSDDDDEQDDFVSGDHLHLQEISGIPFSEKTISGQARKAVSANNAVAAQEQNMFPLKQRLMFSTPPSFMPQDLDELEEVGKSAMPNLSTAASIQRLKYQNKQPVWGKPDTIWIQRETTKFGQGGMRLAYLAQVTEVDACPFLNKRTYVLKQYKTSKIQANSTNARQLKRDIQSQDIVRKLMQGFCVECEKKMIPPPFPRVLPIYLLKIGADTFTMEPYIVGKWEKVLNNTGVILQENSDPAKKLLAFAHWTLIKYQYKAMACDLQGVGYDVTDTQVAHPESSTFGLGNLSSETTNKFMEEHACNDFCKDLGLRPMELGLPSQNKSNAAAAAAAAAAHEDPEDSGEVKIMKKE